MSDTDYSRQTADLFFMKHDQTQELRQFRNFIPEYVLKTFCGSGDPNMLVVYEENQMYARARSLTSFVSFSHMFALSVSTATVANIFFCRLRSNTDGSCRSNQAPHR